MQHAIDPVFGTLGLNSDAPPAKTVPRHDAKSLHFGSVGPLTQSLIRKLTAHLLLGDHVR